MELLGKQNTVAKPVFKKQENFFGKKSSPAFFAPVLIKPKLTIGPVDDPYEREADAVAERVMRMEDSFSPASFFPAGQPFSKIQRNCAACEEEKIQKKEDEEDEMVQAKPISGLIHMKCAACEEKENLIHRKEDEEEEMVQTKPVPGCIQRKCAACEAEENKIYKKESTPVNTPSVTPSVHQTLNSGGQPMDKSTRSFMEQRFGYDFGNVRIHNDSLAHQSSADINARAYTHSNHIVFGKSQYQPNTMSGKQLIAHELTHVVQQVQENKGIQRLVFIPFIVGAGLRYGAGKAIKYGIDEYQDYVRKKNIESGKNTVFDLEGESKFDPWGNLHLYIMDSLQQADQVPVKVRFGDLGQGTILISYNEITGYYNAEKQVISFAHPELDTSGHVGTHVLALSIEANIINGKLGWLTGKSNIDVTNDDYKHAKFNEEDFLPFIYGADYDGKNFSSIQYNNDLSGGKLFFNSMGELSIPNQQKIGGFFQLYDLNPWFGKFLTNIKGAVDSEFFIERTPQGNLSGENDDISLSEEWTGKGFKAKAALRASFVNSNLQVEGSASYESKSRGISGNLMVIVTDYTTAKRFAIDFLPEDIVNKSRTDPPPNPADQLAFAGAGNLSFTLFNGNKESRSLLPDPKGVIGDPPEPQENKALEAEAAFVVEPEGYITIAGQVRAPEVFPLVPAPKKPYEKSKAWDFTIFTIPGPFETRANFVFAVKLSYGASIGPLTLSEIIADGRYSSRPDTASELELSALFKLSGKVFVKLSACFKVEGSILGVFDIDVLEWCPLELELAALGVVQARPTIQVVSPEKDPDRSTPPEYYIRGAFNFDVAGDLIFTIGDSLTINLSKKEPVDPDAKAKDKDVPKDWRYKRNKKTVKNRYGSKDVEIPMDHTLGSEEIPRVSLASFVKDNLEERIKNVITDDRLPSQKPPSKKYFGEGTETLPSKTGNPDPDVPDIKEGGYKEQGEEQGGIEDKYKYPRGEQPSYVFEEEFFMDGAPHKLTLIITEIDKAGTIDFDVVLMMRSELEEISEKIDEEKQDVNDHPDQLSDWKKKDIEQIHDKAKRVVNDAKKLGVNDELSNAARQPALKELAFSIHNYGDRYKKKDFGIPDQTTKPACNEPLDAKKDMEITFTKYKGYVNKGRVIGVAAYKSPNGNFTQWTFQYKPYRSREGTMVAPPAYDENCKPLYFITKPENCEDVKTDHKVLYVGERIVNGEKIKERTKARWVKAWPLCWGPYQEPFGMLVGEDRIKENRQGKWHRAHLIHGNMGGPGLWWNLVPVPKHINNNYMPDKYEKTLKDLVRNGFGVNKRYWFEAKILYQDDWHPVIGHHNDFAKGMEVRFGEIEQDDKGEWTKFKPAMTDMTLDFGSVLRDELEPNRVNG